MSEQQQTPKKSNKKIIIIIVLIALVPITVIGLFLGGAVAIPTYFQYVQKGYASEAKIALKDIHKKCSIYMVENGEYPDDIQSVIDDGYLDLSKTVQENWEFDLNVDPEGETGSITATSTENMGGGEGETVIFDVETSTYSGTLEGGEEGGSE